MADVNIRTTITADSIQRLFGPVDAIDYRAHPAEEQDEDPAVIYRKMREKEVPPLEDITVLKSTVYSFKNRQIITQWLRDVCVSFGLKNTTLCLSIQLTDNYLINNLNNIRVDRCQLAAITAFWIAAKFEELDADLPSLRKVVDVCDRAYSPEEVLDMEEAILRFFKWRLPHVTVVNHLFLQIHLLSSNKLVSKMRSCSTLKDSRGELMSQQEINNVVGMTATTSETNSCRSVNKSDNNIGNSNINEQLSNIAVSNINEADNNLICTEVLILTLNDKNQRVWHKLKLPSTKSLHSCLKELCEVALIHVNNVSSINVFQLYGSDFLIAERMPLSTIVSHMIADNRHQIRLYISSNEGKSNNIFAERNEIVILRGVNINFLDLCDVLLQLIVTHVEFLHYTLPIKAFAILGLAMCLLSTEEVEESKQAIKFICTSLSLSASQGLAVSDLLYSKYVEIYSTFNPSPALPEPTNELREKLCKCFDRKLSS